MNDKLLVERELLYNNLGLLVEIKEKYPEKEKVNIITYTYNIDEKANWIKRIEYVNSVPVKLKERKIQYY